MANPEGGGVSRTIDDGNAVVNSGSGMNKNEPEAASDTEQYGGIDAASHRQGSKKKACFQITHITSKRNDGEHDPNMDDADSNDELDESRIEDYSSSEFNVSRNSISDHELAVNAQDAGVGSGNGNVALAPAAMPAASVSASGSAEEQTNSSSSVVPASKSQANGNGPHRFKVVKVATTEPIKKGRWVCRDFPSESTKNQTTPESLRNQDSSKEALVNSGNSSAASSVHYIHGQDNSSDNPLTQGDESGKQLDLKRKISSASSKGNPDNTDDEKDERLGLEQLKDGLQDNTSDGSEGDDGTSPAGGAIDNKIEQAMDLVKSHLLFAVREEVEVLKEQIKILVEKNEMLQEENSTLKQRLQQQPKPALQQQQQQNINMPSQQQQQQQQQQQHGISMSSQEQPTYTGMPGPNQLGQTISDHAAYPQHPRATQQTHSTPNPGGLPEATPQYTPQGGIDSQQGQYQGMHSQQQQQQQQQRHIGAGQAQGQPPQTHLNQGGMQERSQYSQVAATQPSAQPQQMQGQFQTTMAPGARQNANH